MSTPSILRVTIIGLIFGFALANAHQLGATPVRIGAEQVGVRFVQQALSAGIVPAHEAVASAQHMFGSEPSAAVTTRYGLLSDDQYYTVDHATGTRHYPVQQRPVWLVTFSNLDLPSHGPGPIAYNHELNVVVDAITGQTLYSYTYR